MGQGMGALKRGAETPLQTMISKLLQTCYFGYFQFFWPRSPKMNIST